MKNENLLRRNVVSIYPNKEELERKISQEKIKLYLGIDPSNSLIHLGNAVVLRKLAEFQELGHKVILVIGDFTGMIGDPTDKGVGRAELSREEILKNAKTYKNQVAKILRFAGPNAASFKFNSNWLAKLSLADVIELSSLLTVSQLEERDMFVQRKKEGNPIYLHEFLYPLLQGYDSVALDVDLEVGGTDQTFNMLVGRQLVKGLKNKEKYVLTIPLLLGTDGQKMGKTTGNFIAINDSPEKMFGKIMSLKDDLIKHYFELATNADLDSIDFKSNPMDLKKQLAYLIVEEYYGEAAKGAKKEFENVFQRGKIPQSIIELPLISGTTLTQFLISNNIVSSHSAVTRLANDGAIEIDGKVVKNSKSILQDQQVLKIGKKKFVKAVQE